MPERAYRGLGKTDAATMKKLLEAVMSVRCKFRCLEITDRFSHTDAEGVVHKQPTVRLVPVMYRKGQYDPGEENKYFWSATPSGNLEMTITNPDAAKQFEVGKCYYLDVSEAPE